MKCVDQNLSGTSMIVLLVSLVAWSVLACNPMGLRHHPISLASQLATWAVMVVAMMSPTLILPIQQICVRSFRHLRAPLVVLFSLAYGCVWVSTGVLLLAAAPALVDTATQRLAPLFALAIAIALVLLWQCSPLKQLCLNHVHGSIDVEAFGCAAAISAVRQGLRHGLWCVLSCWPLMLLALLIPRGHLGVMALAMLVVVGESLDLPKQPRWQLRLPATLIQLLMAQAMIRLRRYGPPQPMSELDPDALSPQVGSVNP